DNEEVEYKCLVAAESSSPACITTDELRALEKSGTRVMCSDREAADLAAKADFRREEIERRDVALADWIRRFDHHIFVLALVGDDKSPVSPEGLPDTFASFVAGSGFRVGVIGTGEFRAVSRIVRNETKAEFLKRRYDLLWPHEEVRLRVAL